MMSMAAVALAGTFTSCSKEKDLLDPEAAQNQIVLNYQQAFIKTFGQPAANQDWGFGSTLTRTADPRSNMWKDEGYVIPADITEDEIEKVLAVFNQKGEEHYESLVDWDCFFVQQVWKGTASYKAGNGGDVVGGNQMDWLCAGSSAMGDDHVNNFNNASGSIMLMINSSTQRFGYKSSTDNGHVFYYFRMVEIDGAYYVGFDFSAEGQNPNEQVKRDYIYNDWIVKIVPGKGITPSTPGDGEEGDGDNTDNPSNNPTDWEFVARVFAEDLSASTGSDFDFNDVVFDVYYTTGQTKIEILAAGGTLPLRVAGKEVHEAFAEVNSALNITTSTMINTGADVEAEVNPVIILNYEVKTPAEVKAIEIAVEKEIAGIETTWYEVTAETGKPAAKFAVEDQIEWASERQPIEEKYPEFPNWVQNGTLTNWWK